MKIQDTIICEESWIFLTHGQVTRSWTTTWSIEQRPFIKNPRYFSCMIRLSDHKPQASHRNKDHLRKILDIFHTRASYLVMNHRLVVRAETIPGKFWIFSHKGKLLDQELRANRSNKDHSWTILDIFHARASYLIMNHGLATSNRDYSWKILDIFHTRIGYPIKNHVLVTQTDVIREK
jgi:hypothetical protein